MRNTIHCSFLILLFFVVSSATAQQQASITGRLVACQSGDAAGFPCNSVNLASFVGLRDLGSGFANDNWGWTDPEDGHEYAIVGLFEGTAFVDITDPVRPIYLGTLPIPATARGAVWRDIKTYANHAFIVADGAGPHGMQVFDLTQLRDITSPPFIFTANARYEEIGSAHNIVINEESGFAYAVGASGRQSCGGGLHIIDIRTPQSPTFVGCYERGGYSHDAQCVMYHGPDTDYQGKEVCFGSNETHLEIVNLANKVAPEQIAAGFYPAVGYTHQGWLTEDHRYFFMNDEADELQRLTLQTRTIIWDVTDLDDPVVLGEYMGQTPSIDHNLYIRGNYVFEANYTSGLRILDISDVASPREVAFFDTVPNTNRATFAGAWSVYPFFPSGNIIITSSEEGLFVVQATGVKVATETESVPASFTLDTAYPNPFNPSTTLTLSVDLVQTITLTAYDVLGRQVQTLHNGILEAGTHHFSFDAGELPGGVYMLRAEGQGHVATQTVTLLK